LKELQAKMTKGIRRLASLMLMFDVCCIFWKGMNNMVMMCILDWKGMNNMVM